MINKLKLIPFQIGLLVGLIFLVGCLEINSKKNSEVGFEYRIGTVKKNLVFIKDKQLLGFATDLTNNPNLVIRIEKNRFLTIESYFDSYRKRISLSEPITSITHHFFGDLSSGIIYSSSLDYNGYDPDCVYKIDINSGEVEKLYVEVGFTDYGERFGRSLISQFARNDTFFLGFGYPYINGPASSELGVWDVPHMGMGYLEGDTIRFIKAFGYQRPKLYKEYIWKHPKMYYVPERNEVLFGYYWSPSLLVYNFKGEFKQKVTIDIDGFNKQNFYGNSYKPGCFGSGEWDAYMCDSVLHFSQLGYSPKLQCYYRTVRFATGDERGKSAIVFFNEKGEEKKLITGFNDEYGIIFPKEKSLDEFYKAYDSLNYRVIKYNRYDYPKDF